MRKSLRTSFQPSDKDIFERDEEQIASIDDHNYIDISDNSMGLDKRIDRILKAVHSEKVRSRKSVQSAKVRESAGKYVTQKESLK